MSVLQDFYTTDSIRLDPVGLNIIEPPMFGLTPVIPGGVREETVPCIAKRLGSLGVTLTIVGISIPFSGTFLGVDSMGRWLIRWSIDDRTPRPFRGLTTIRRVQGQITIAIAPLTPFRTDLTNCAGAAGEFFVSLSIISGEEVEERFGRLPNEIRVEADSVTPVHALITNVQGTAGATAPSPTPWPQPSFINLSSYCVPSVRITPTIYGEVRLDHSVLRSHLDFTCVVSAEGLEPARMLEVHTNPPIGNYVFFEILLPPDLTGTVLITAVTNDRSHTRTARFGIGGGFFGCGGPIEAKYYDPIRIGCEDIDCGWTGLNDLSELIGRSGGWAVRYLTTRRIIDSVGRLVGKEAFLKAINNRGTVIGIVDYANGKMDSFIYGEPMSDGTVAPELSWVFGVTLQAINDAGIAVGARLEGDRMIPVQWMKGDLKDIQVPSFSAIIFSIDGAGNVAGLHIPKANAPVQGFFIDAQGFHDIGSLKGDIVSLTMNGAGTIAGTAITGQKVNGFIYSQKTGILNLDLPIGEHRTNFSCRK